MSVHLPWLVDEVERRGAVTEMRHLTEPRLRRSADLVVCAGLGASTLAGDDSVVPVRGQIVRVANPAFTLSIRDEHHPDGRAYVHPRVDG